MNVSDAKRLKELGAENRLENEVTREALRQMVAAPARGT